MGLRVAPQEVELLTLWAFHQPLLERLWVVAADQWGDSRSDSSMTVAVQLGAAPAGVEPPDISGWEDQLNGLVPPDVSLRIIRTTDPEPTSLGGVEVFRRPKTAGRKA